MVQKSYLRRMTPAPSPGLSTRLAIGAAAVALLGGLAGLGFALWSQNGPRMFMALVESGLAWCF